MLLLGLGIGLMIFGIVALIKGKLTLSKKKVVEGVPARVIGAGFLLPLPVSFVIAIAYAAVNVAGKGQAEVDAWGKDNTVTITLVQAGSMIFLAVVLIVIAALLAKPVRTTKSRSRRKPAEDYDDYEDERPRRRRSADDDDEEDEDRPRRKRRDDFDDRAR